MKDEVMKAIEENRLYDFIANNYWKMSKEELKDVILELAWVCGDIETNDANRQYLLTCLSERWGD